MSDLVERLEIKSGMMKMGEKIAWGSDTALMDEAAARITALEQENARLKSEHEAIHAAALMEAEEAALGPVFSTLNNHGEPRYHGTEDDHWSVPQPKANVHVKANGYGTARYDAAKAIAALATLPPDYVVVKREDAAVMQKISNELSSQMADSLNAYCLPLWPEEAAAVERVCAAIAKVTP
jgi:hypothetical protein